MQNGGSSRILIELMGKAGVEIGVGIEEVKKTVVGVAKIMMTATVTQILIGKGGTETERGIA